MTHDTRSSPRQGNRPARAGQSSGRPSQVPVQMFTDTEIDQANENAATAFALLGLVEGSNLVCPECGNAKKKTVQIKVSKSSGKTYWKCFPCGANSSATKLLQDKGGMSFREAVSRLLGREYRGELKKVEVPKVHVEPAFIAVVDVEVYETIRSGGSVGGAQEYWGQWHIDPEVTKTAGSTMVTVDDPEVYKALVHAPLDSSEYQEAWRRHRSHFRNVQKDLTQRFGIERLRACGVVKLTESKKDYFLVNEDYCIIEPHETPTGVVVGMQFRPVGQAKAKVDAHKTWKRQWAPVAAELWPEDPDNPDAPRKGASDAWARAYAEDPKKAGERHEYVTPFLSLRGAGPDSLVGCGLRVLGGLPDKTPAYIVEGFKDMLAARTLGAQAYAIPGTGNMPPEKVCDSVLSRLEVIISLDGDAGGEKGRKLLTSHFAAMGRNTIKASLKDADVAERGVNVLQDNETLQGLVPAGFTLQANGEALLLSFRNNLPEGVSFDDVAGAYASLVRQPKDKLQVARREISASLKPPMRAGMDVADVLVERRAHQGCGCKTCLTWRSEHPADPKTCPCASCTGWRSKRTT